MRTAEDRARDLHTRGLAAIGGGRPADGARLFHKGLELLGRQGPLAARILISLAAAQVQLGESQAGFETLDSAEALTAPEDRGILLLQRGLLCMLVGRMDDALRYLNEGIPLHSGTSDHYGVASALLNRAMLHSLAGRVRLARADLIQCQQVARDADLPLLVAKSQLNLGYCETLAGDIPAALRAFDQARPRFATDAQGLLPVLAVDRARALLQAGLADEAASELDTAIELLDGPRATHERAEAELIRAHAALAQGDLAAARTWGHRAEAHFLRRGNESWAAIAALVRLRADFRARRRLFFVARKAAGLAVRLDELGMPTDAEAARLLAARALIARGRAEEAVSFLDGPRTSWPILDTRLLRQLARAEFHAAQGDATRTLRHVRSGLSLLDEHRSRFGSVDLRTGTALLGKDLAHIGLTTALEHRGATAIFGWSERARAQAFLTQPVRPPADPEIADTVAELRQLGLSIREAELAGRADPADRRRSAELEHRIREHGWRTTGSMTNTQVADIQEVVDELAAADLALISFLPDGVAVRALVLAGDVRRVVTLGEPADIAESVARLRGDLDALCGRRHPASILKVVRGSLDYQVDHLTATLIQPLLDMVGDRDVVIVPTGPLSSIPWSLLPPLRGRAVTVAVSASAWLYARRAPASPSTQDPLLVAGPHLDFAADEVRKIAGIFPGSTVLAGPAASVGDTLSELDGRHIAHIAAHGHHEPGNYLFARLDLADGPLMAYDIDTLPSPPEHVVLSACDVGRTIVRAGDEMLGFAAAFLYSGTKSVVAGVARVADDAAVDVMARYYDRLFHGATPSSALAEASLSAPLIPLVCFGSC
ncbi:CHAT domain-containing tetratricopeptide repeat protein [Actinocrispum sp. NPDC049592]|uniref:CHAT domain-containing protein n=1 Tax=Actinocrispum sp. NPDC049592 TaxID=3154835 RepID=UPI0034438681